MNTNRRAFVQKTLLGSVGFLAGNALLQAAEEPKKLNEIGLILGVLKNEMKTDWEGTLRQVAKMGYTHLEFNKYYDESAASFKSFMKELGLKPLAGGLSISEMKKENLLKRAINEALFLEKKYMI